MGIKIDLLELLSFEMNSQLRGIYEMSKKDVFYLINSNLEHEVENGDLQFESSTSGSFKKSKLTLVNQTVYSYFMNDQLFGMEFLNWRTRTSYIKEDETILNFYKNSDVMNMGLSEILDFFEKHNINVSLTESEDDPNYLRINCDKYEDWTNWDQLIIFHKGNNRIDYFLANKNSVWSK
jgi:hypothetical protein